MLSPEAERTAKAHLILGEGFIKTAKVREDSSQYETRNAFSRAYYAMFHVCCALLFGAGVDMEKVERVKEEHGRLHTEMQKRMGKAFGRFLRESYELRRESDYKPEWVPPASQVTGVKLKAARTQFYWLFSTANNQLSH
jgi:uncharacterized protein (UPF0332 family)